MCVPLKVLNLSLMTWGHRLLTNTSVKCLLVWTVSSALQDTEPARFFAVQVYTPESSAWVLSTTREHSLSSYTKVKWLLSDSRVSPWKSEKKKRKRSTELPLYTVSNAFVGVSGTDETGRWNWKMAGDGISNSIIKSRAARYVI